MDSLSKSTAALTDFGALPLASVAFPVLAPAERDLLFRHRDRITLADARAFLHSKGVHSELRRGFGTSARRRRLRQAVDFFEDRLRRWLEGNRQSRRIAWLVPLGEDVETVLNRIYRALLETNDYPTFVGLHHLLRLPNAPQWTSFVSSESIRLARMMSQSHHVRLERAFTRGAESLGLPGGAPSDPERPPHQLALPVPAESGAGGPHRTGTQGGALQRRAPRSFGSRGAAGLLLRDHEGRAHGRGDAPGAQHLSRWRDAASPRPGPQGPDGERDGRTERQWATFEESHDRAQ